MLTRTIFPVLSIFFAILSVSHGLIKGLTRSGPSLTKLALSGAFNPVICGAAGGTAETIACNVLDLAKHNQIDEVTLILDQAPFSPKLLSHRGSEGIKLNVFFGELERGKVQKLGLSGNVEATSVNFQQILDKRVIVAVDDLGDAAIRQEVIDKKSPRKNQALEVLQQLSRVAPSSVSSVVCGISLETEKEQSETGIGKLISGNKGISMLRKWSESSNVPFSSIRYGELVGAVPGLEPIPFLSLPLAEPELDPSYELLSVVCSSKQDIRVSTKEKCTRDNLANVLTRLFLKQRVALQQRQGVPLAADNSLIISIPGNSPTEREWDSIFQRLLVGNAADGVNNVVLTMEFGKILKPQSIINYLVENWFGQALLETSTATIAVGARPVRIVRKTFDKDLNGVSIVWEALDTTTLQVKSVGSLDIILDVRSDPPALKVIRNAKAILPSESPLLDKLQEGINGNAYKKQFCEPLSVST